MQPELLSQLNPARSAWEHWVGHARREPEAEAVVHVVAGEAEPFRWRWGPLLAAASSIARRLAERGVARGDVCALILRHHPSFYPVYMAISGLGALPAVLAYPNARLHPDKFREGLAGMAAHSGLDWVLTERELADVVAPLVKGGAATVRDVLFPLELADGPHDGPVLEKPPAGADAPCLLQHSSGTTGLQKPVVLSHRAILEHVRRYAERIGARGDDRVVSWLPLYHDMGLIAAWYLPTLLGLPVVQLSPMDWVAAPAMLLEALARERGTVAWLPNFSYNFMADRIREEDLDGVRLDHVRLLVNCSEPVRAESHDRFAERFAPLGLRREALSACYAMAETTFAVTQTPPGREARRLTVDRAELARGNVVPAPPGPGARTLVSSGTPIDGCALRVVDGDGREVPPGRVGEVTISSVSLFDGYRNHPEKTRAVLRDGWYWSGDLGFVEGGECFVVGRRKDVIILAGNNVYPEDVEDAVGKVPGVAPGRVVAFGADDERSGTEVLCVVAETAEGAEGTAADPRALRLAILRAGMAVDVSIARVYLVPPRWLVKSSSGKPARSTNRDRALAQLTPV